MQYYECSESNYSNNSFNGIEEILIIETSKIIKRKFGQIDKRVKSFNSYSNIYSGLFCLTPISSDFLKGISLAPSFLAMYKYLPENVISENL